MTTLFTPAQWLLALLGALLVGLAKTGVGGLGIFAVAIFANLFPARQSTGVILPLLVCADIIAVAYYKRHAVWEHLWRLIPWVVPGIVVGTFAMGRINDAEMQKLIGAILVSMVGLHVWRQQRASPHPAASEDEVSHSLWFAAVMGLLAGFTTMVANAAGPIMVIYLLAMRLPKMEFLGTGAWYFLLLNTFKLPFSYGLHLITANSLMLNLLLAPAVILGALGGRVLIRHINQRSFELLALILTLLAGLRLIL